MSYDAANANDDDNDAMIFPPDENNDHDIFCIISQCPDAPKRFKSAYICFVMEKMEEARANDQNDSKVASDPSNQPSQSSRTVEPNNNNNGQTLQPNLS